IMHRRTTLPAFLAGGAILALTLAGCSGGGGGGGDEPVSGGVFRHAVYPEVGSIEPMTANQPQELQILTYAYEGLIYTDGEGEEYPWLA
ncbi:MAG: hypothetical protein G3W69_32135, partial [Xanthomonas perforans]|nr:hypothetical protein [Xanthomonas perforans]